MWTKIKDELKQGKNLIGFGFLSTLSQVSEIGIPLVIAGLLAKDIFASFGLARMFIFMVAAFTISSTQHPFIVQANQERAKTGKISKSIGSQLIFFITSILLFLLMILLFRNPVSRFAFLSHRNLIYLGFAYVGFAIRFLMSGFFLALGKRNLSALSCLVCNILAVIFVLLLHYLHGARLDDVFLSYFLSSIITALIFICFVDRAVVFPIVFDLKHFRTILKLALWVVLGTTSAYFLNWGDNFVLRAYGVDRLHIGDYLFAYSLFKGMLFTASAVSNYFLPFLSANIDKKEKLRNYLLNKRPRIIAVGLCILVAAFLAFPYCLRFVYGTKYIEAETILRILFIGVALTLYNVFYRSLFYALNKFRAMSIIGFAQIIINLALDIVLVPYMGIMGAAIATLVGYICRTIILEAYYRLSIRKTIGI